MGLSWDASRLQGGFILCILAALDLSSAVYLAVQPTCFRLFTRLFEIRSWTLSLSREASRREWDSIYHNPVWPGSLQL